MAKRIGLFCALMMMAFAVLTACGGSAPMFAAKEAGAPASAPAEPAPESSRGYASADREQADYLALAPGAGAAPSPAALPPQAPKPGPVSTPTVGQSGEVAVMRGPMLIYTAQITMAVYEVNKGLADVEELGRDLGGFLARRDDRAITIRVPVGRFPEAVKRIEKMGDMLHRNVTAEDVTEEFRDVEVRLKNSRAVRDRLEQLLQKAVKVEESVIIEKELGRVTQEIEQMEGRIKFLKDRAAFSTITVTFEAHRQENVSSTFKLPVPWLSELGLGRLLSL